MLEFLKQPGVYEVTLILSGVLFHKAIISILGIINLYKYYQEVGNSSFTILLSTYVMILAGLDFKENYLKECGMDEVQISIAMETDKKVVEDWKDISLKSLHQFAPKIFSEINDSYNDKD